jgi:Fe-S-cluster-containing hydrogenase component 2
MMDLNFIVDSKKCLGCNACVSDCPRNIIKLDTYIPKLLNDHCLQCQHCLAVCPTGAISILGFKPENSIPLDKKSLPSKEQMKTFVRARRSVRQFAQEDVSPALIDELLSDTANAPTGCNDRELTFTVIDGMEAMQGLRWQVISSIEQKQEENIKIPSFLLNGVQNYKKYGIDDFFRNAPHLLIVSVSKKATCGQEDVLIALSYFEFLAQSAGLGTTWCGMLKFVLDAIPELAGTIGLTKDTAYCYAMMFGKPSVKYARTVQQDKTAKINKIKTFAK